MFFCSHFQAQEDLSKQLQVMKSMLYGAESSAAATSAAGQNQDQQSDIVLAQLSQVMTLRLLSRFQDVGLLSKTWLTLHLLETSWATRLCSGFLLSALSLCLFVPISLYLPSISHNLTLNMPAC
jgi:hypothetical protein